MPVQYLNISTHPDLATKLPQIISHLIACWTVFGQKGQFTLQLQDEDGLLGKDLVITPEKSILFFRRLPVQKGPD